MKWLINNIEKGKSIPLILIRFTLAYGFYNPAILKWKDINGIATWFETLKIPAPLLSAYLAAGTESLGVVLLVLGLGTRIIVIPLIFTLIVAIKTVHFVNGFEAGQNGFEIPLYYIVMLLTVFVYGPGKLSMDQFFRSKIDTLQE